MALAGGDAAIRHPWRAALALVRDAFDGDAPLDRLPLFDEVRGKDRKAVEQMLAAFHLNLTALSSIALLVGLFLVYNTVSTSVIARRDEIGTLRALGLRGIGQTNTLPDRPEIRGMIAKVPHLVRVDETAREEQ